MSEKHPLDYPCPTCKVPPGVACVYEQFSMTPRQYAQSIDGRHHHARVVRAARKSKKRRAKTT